MFKTYSFQDVRATISHPNVGQSTDFVITGEGVGSINVNMSNDRTAHDVAADGSVMISKILTKNGTIVITAQQTSSIHQWLLKWANYVCSEVTPASEYAKANLTIEADSTGETIDCSGVTPQKIADRVYQQQGQNVSWTLMAAKIETKLV